MITTNYQYEQSSAKRKLILVRGGKDRWGGDFAIEIVMAVPVESVVPFHRSPKRANYRACHPRYSVSPPR